MGWLVGTGNGLFGQSGDAWLDGREITALTPEPEGWSALADGRDVVRFRDGAVETVASIEEELGRCLLTVADGVLVGTANARLAMAHAGSVEMSASFDDAKGRESWYTPLAASDGLVLFGAEDRLFVSEDAGVSWRDTGTAYPEITCVAIAPGTGAP